MAPTCRFHSESFVQSMVGCMLNNWNRNQRSGDFRDDFQVPNFHLPSFNSMLGSSPWSFSHKISVLTMRRLSTDEASSNISLCLNKDEKYMLQTDGGVIDFWLAKKHSFHNFHYIALRISTAFASSASGERYFSALVLAVSQVSSHLKPHIINGYTKF